MSEPKSVMMHVRVTPETKRRFAAAAAEKAAEFEGTSSDVLRELVIAFVEGRVTVVPRCSPTL